VIKNQIDYNLPCWNYPQRPAPRKKICRVGWVGGIHHEEDVREISNYLMGVNSKVGVENVRWDFYGRPPLPQGEEPDWQQDVWDQYEKILAHGLKRNRKNWQVLQALPCHAYGAFYTDMDVSIAPLQYNAFNDSKSEIKVMECGRYGIPLIASDVGCYSETIINGETGYLITKDNPRSEWVRILTKVCKDKKHREEMGRNLKQIVDERFDINKTVGQRLDLYRQLMNLKETAKNEQQKTQNI
jgi:glycosyltransferase involved in cell wall biosynthesis